MNMNIVKVNKISFLKAFQRLSYGIIKVFEKV